MRTARELPILSVTRIEEFWYRRVDIQGEDECWLWKGTVNRLHGYGLWTIVEYTSKGREHWHLKPHRMALFLAQRNQLRTDRMVCHVCDVKLCCNPMHLFEGTAKDNAQDMVAKDRGASPNHRGPGSSVSKQMAKSIKQDFADGMSISKVSQKYGIGVSHAHRIKHGKAHAVDLDISCINGGVHPSYFE